MEKRDRKRYGGQAGPNGAIGGQKGEDSTKEREEKEKKRGSGKKTRGEYLFWMAVCLHPYPRWTLTIPNMKPLKIETEMIAPA